MRTPICLVPALAVAVLAAGPAAQSSAPAPASTEAANARRFERAVNASHRVLQAWLNHADPIPAPISILI